MSPTPVTVVAATDAELRQSAGRVAWDRDLYGCLIRWGAGSVRAADARPALRSFTSRWSRRAVRLVRSRPRLRTSWPVRRLGDFSQIEAFQVAPEAEVLYGNIVFPVAVGRRLPVVWSTQGVIDARPGIWFPEESARTHSILISRSAVTQCWSQVGFGGLLARRPQIPADRVKVIPPLIYIDLPPPVEPPDGDLRALFVGWDARLKGLPVVLDALSAVGPGVRLEVITAGAAPEGLPSHVDWLGPQPRQEVLRRLRRADIHVFPSRTESFGVAALEAMAAGVAQVVDSNGVPAEVAGGGALTVDGSDASDLRRAVERLAGDRELRAALGREGLRRWQTRYCPEVVGPQLEAALAAAASAGLQP